MKTLLAAASALALAACGGQTADNENSANDPTVNLGIDSSGDNVATDNLTVESSPSNVDQAINQTDQQSGVPDAANSAANTVTNNT